MPIIELEHYVDYYDTEKANVYSEGDFLLGKKHGTWIYNYPNGKKQEEANYTNGKLSGKLIYWFDNGQRQSEGYFKLIFQSGVLSSVRDSLYKEWYPNGNMAQKGSYAYDTKDGDWVFWFPEGDKWKESKFVNGLELSINCWDKDRNQSIKNGNGIQFDYWKSGPLRSRIAVQDSIFNGNAEYFYENSNPEMEGTLKGSLRNGIWKFYYEDGGKTQGTCI